MYSGSEVWISWFPIIFISVGFGIGFSGWGVGGIEGLKVFVYELNVACYSILQLVV
jgi:hypothetical protein